MTNAEKDRKIFIESFPGWKCFQTFDDNSDRKSKKLVMQVSTENFQYPIDGEIDFMTPVIPVKIFSDLEARNHYGAGVYLCINETNGKGRTTQDITNIRAVFADLDGSPLDPVWEYNPSMVVESSPDKFHAYWLTTQEKNYSVPLESFRTIQESISNKFKSDPVVKDLPRVMRIPGFYHMKGKPFLSRILYFEDKHYNFGELVEMFPPKPVKQWSAPKYQKKSETTCKEFSGNYGACKGGRNHHVLKRIGGAYKRGLAWHEIEQEAFKEALACSPPLSETETRAILKSFRRYV